MLKWLAIGAAVTLGVGEIADYVAQNNFRSDYACVIETSHALGIETEFQLDSVIAQCKNR